MEVQNPPSPINSTTAVISSAQLLALGGTPVEVVPSPGPNKLIVVIGVSAIFRAGANQYTSAGDSLLVVYNNGTGDSVTPAIINLVTNAISGNNYQSGTVDGHGDLSLNTNANLVLFNTNGYSAGDGTLEITTFYQVISV